MSTEVMSGFFVFVMLFFVANIVLVIWALVDAIRVPEDSMYRAGSKLIWVLVILLAGFIGAIVYFAVGRPSRSESGSPPAGGVGNIPPPPPGSVT